MLFRLATTTIGVAIALLGHAAVVVSAQDDDVDIKLPLQATAETPWQDLADAVSSPEVFSGPTDINEWVEQCVDPFKLIGAIPDYGGEYDIVSNYYLLNATSGLCLDFASCAFMNCLLPTPENIETYPYFSSGGPFALPAGDYNVLDSLASDQIVDPLWNLPARVVHPKTVADVVHAVQFARDNSVGITIKVNGHSYFGSSSARNTLLVKMSTYYPKYDELGSLMECFDYQETEQEGSANYMACHTAMSRGKNAILRVGGGSFFDHAYRAVSVTWNNNPNNTNKYHLVGGGAGTVSAAGGWMASGGLSGTTGMRLFGIGIDQVVHLEMVLPSGTHVRFGPSAFNVPDAPQLTPETTEVTGYCNYQWTMPEDEWEWTECTGDDADIDFDELWFAVRGGGGGTWGIVTSLYYQLHDYPGFLVYTSSTPDVFANFGDELTTNIYATYTIALLFVRFVLGFLYHPATMNVTAIESNGCSSAKSFSMSPFRGGTFFCYGPSGPKLVEKWSEYITADDQVAALQAAGTSDELVDALTGLFIAGEPYAPSYAEAMIFFTEQDPNWEFPGRVPDAPKAAVVPVLDNFGYQADSTNTHFPLFVVMDKFDELCEILAEDVLFTPDGQSIYAKGGVIPYTSDGLNALSPTRRMAAFQKAVRNETTRARYYELFYADADMEGPFPGQGCHNHAQNFEMGPMKDDWTMPCPLDWPQSEREKMCVSQGENFWGTENLARLEAFKETIDPDGIFLCAAGIGYSNPAKASPIFGGSMEEEEVDSTTMEEDGDATMEEEGDAMDGAAFPKEESEDEAEVDVERTDAADSAEKNEESANEASISMAVSHSMMRLAATMAAITMWAVYHAV